jgi:long-chain fatty acid transport protein
LQSYTALCIIGVANDREVVAITPVFLAAGYSVEVKAMRRELLAPIAMLLLAAGIAHAGMMTNVNQSAAFVRMPARNATLGIDGVYYNPAGLTRLIDGWYFSFNNQFVLSDRRVENDYSYLNDAPSSAFPADANTGLFPGFFAVYKTNKTAFSFGFNPIGGVGGTDYSRGLPLFEMIISDLIPALQMSYGVTGYSAEIDFKETSACFGYQLGVSHEINPTLSLFGGGRLVTVKKTYSGGISNILINPTTGYDGSYRRADVFAAQNAASFTSKSQSYSSAAASVQSLITAGAGNYTIAQVQTAGFITSAQRAQYENALADLGLSSAQIAALRMNQVHTYYEDAATHYATNASLMTGIQWLTSDRELKVTQTGAGFAPILGLNLNLGRNWTVAVKYEFATRLELENDTQVDQFGSYPDGATVRRDLPAMLSLGTSYAYNSRLGFSSGLNYYFDRSADYGLVDAVGKAVDNSDIIDANYLELAAGVEYGLNDRLLLSAGYMFGKSGVSEEYQSLVTLSLDSHTLGFGGQYLITPNVALNMGCSFILYSGDGKEYSHYQAVPAVLPFGTDSDTPPPAWVSDTYSRSDLIFAVGVDYIIR